MESSIASLRPRRLGEILDQAIRMYRRNFATFTGIVALIFIPFMLITQVITYFFSKVMGTVQYDPSVVLTPSFLLPYAGVSVVGILRFILLDGLASAVISRAVTDQLTGQPTGILQAYQRIGSSWGRIILTLTLMVFIIFLLVLATLIPCVGWLIGPGMLIFIGLVVNPLLAPTLALENKGVGASIRRAWDLGRQRFWWLLGFMIILYLLALLIVSGPSFIVSFVLAALFGAQFQTDYSLITTIANGLVAIITGVLYIPLQFTAFTLVYYDLRIRTEGLDLSLLSLQNSEAPIDGEVIRDIPTPGPSETLVKWNEVGNFAIITIGVGGLCALFYAAIVALFVMAMGAAGGF